VKGGDKIARVTSSRPAAGHTLGGHGTCRFDYVTVGHVTRDVLDDGSERPGGSAFYSALQAARLGARTLIVTRGAPAEIEELLAPYRHELELEVLPAPRTTTLQTSDRGGERRQRVLAWAGPMTPPALAAGILHLAPVARELSGQGQARADFVGLTLQGLLRRWSENGTISLQAPGEPPAGESEAEAPTPGDVATLGALTRCDAIVLSEHERASARRLLQEAAAAGATIVVTAGAGPITLQPRRDERVRVDAIPVNDFRDDVGAGDVFAAAFFVALHDGRAAVEAATFAAAAAAVRIEGAGPGAIGGRPTIEARLRRARA
jgi:1D-myo-inositol 3-kinase